ncbi:secretin/TonB-like protein [Sphingosinicella microcystinivorans]|uniref:Secretin/TonB-like protein n=1 Tax=Sphingosinicella microcystinivorans TaxID=335406 RepID=A0ABX9SUX6_SPHMI|nr:secretin/TonB-like protein [Sphingosinicella microcystinivorans]
MSTFQDSFRAGVSAFALAIGAVCATAPALAQSSITLPSDSLESSLNALSRQTGVQILVDQTLLKGKKAQAIRSVSSVQAALTQLLRGSGLTYQKRGDAFLIIQDARPSKSSADIAPIERQAVADTQVASGEDIGAAGNSETIVVTGSRIARPELESPMPISVVNMQQAERAGRFSAYDALQLNPAVAPGLGFNNAVSNQNAGASFVDLRGLGAERSLTLVDSRRRVSASNGSSAVDIGMIPSVMIDRVEVVTGGAAAVYGADAVTGVTNVITKDYLDGLHISFNQGISQKGDGLQTRASIATGGNFANDRGSFIIGGTYTNVGEILSKDRRFSRNLSQIWANPANTGPNDGIPDLIMYRNQRSQTVGYDPSYLLNGKRYTFNENGPVAFHAGTVIVPESMFDGGDGANFYERQRLQGDYESYAFISKVAYKLTDAIEWHGRIDYGRSLYDATYINLFRQDLRANQAGGRGGDRAYLDNPYLPDFLRTIMVDNGLSELAIERSYANFPLIQARHDRDTFTVNSGLSGALGRLKWDAFWQYGRSTDEITYVGIPQVSRYAAARDAIADPLTGQAICRDSTARAQGCVPFSIFSQQPLNEAQHNWLFGYQPVTRRTNTQNIVGGNISGDIFDLPYGPLVIVAGAEYRRETIEMRGDGLAQQGDFTHSPLGIDAFQTPIDASQSVSEAYTEVVVPILGDLPFAHRLEIEGAYRYSDYSTGITTSTWKAGGSWEPIEGITFRGVRSRSVRAPNFGELYAPQRFVASGQPIDPCSSIGNYNASPTRAANCAALGISSPIPAYSDGPTVSSGGNPDLAPETSNSLTLGVIVRPKFLPGFDLSADYWDIGIDGVIASFSAATLYNLCVDLPSIDNPFCAAQTRDPATHKLVSVNTFLINAQKLNARGFDFSANYRSMLGEGNFHAGLMGSLMTKRLFETTPGQPAGDVNTLGNSVTPRFKATLLLNYDVRDISFALTNRFVSAGKIDLTDIEEQLEGNRIRPYLYTDISIGLDVAERYKIVLGVNNLFNTGAPQVPSASGGWNVGGYYDVVGRYFYTTVKVKL